MIRTGFGLGAMQLYIAVFLFMLYSLQRCITTYEEQCSVHNNNVVQHHSQSALLNFFGTLLFLKIILQEAKYFKGRILHLLTMCKLKLNATQMCLCRRAQGIQSTNEFFFAYIRPYIQHKKNSCWCKLHKCPLGTLENPMSLIHPCSVQNLKTLPSTVDYLASYCIASVYSQDGAFPCSAVNQFPCHPSVHLTKTLDKSSSDSTVSCHLSSISLTIPLIQITILFSAPAQREGRDFSVSTKLRFFRYMIE